MSILFEETKNTKGKRKKGKSVNNLAKLQSDLFGEKDEKQGNSNFFGSEDLFDQSPIQKKQKEISKVEAQSNQATSEDKLQIFFNENPSIQRYVLLTHIFDDELNDKQKVEKIVRYANKNTTLLSHFARKIVFMLEDLDNNKLKLLHEIKNVKIQPGYTYRYVSLYSLKYYNKLKILNIKIRHTKQLQNITQTIGNLLDIAIKYPKDKEVKLNLTLLESDLADLSNSKKLAMTNKIQAIIKKKMNKLRPVDIEIKDITKLCVSLFKEEDQMFPDQGIAEGLFNVFIMQMPSAQREYIEKCTNECAIKPYLIGKIILNCTSNFLQVNNLDSDTYLKYYFLLFARYFFARMFSQFKSIEVKKINVDNFKSKVKLFLNHSPLELGFTENFLPIKYKTMALNEFPADNPYKEAINAFATLPFFTCPIDFCKAMHEGLKIVQNIASQISFEQKYQATGKVYAKSDHLLCLDDLFDITLITMLLANPVPVYQLVIAFEPYIEGLQMVSELEFAFTNLHALMNHINNLDVKKFSEDVKMRVEEILEDDPLNIMSSKK